MLGVSMLQEKLENVGNSMIRKHQTTRETKGERKHCEKGNKKRTTQRRKRKRKQMKYKNNNTRRNTLGDKSKQ